MPDWKKVYPEVEWISDRALQSLVVKVWDEAYRLGGWTGDDISSIPFTLLVSGTPVTLAEHTRVVTTICRNVAAAMKEKGSIALHNDHLIAGALLHDVGKLLEYRKTPAGFEVSKTGKLLRHPLSGMGIALKEGVPEEVYHIIAVHSREGDGSYRSPEAIVLHHADFTAFETIKALGGAPAPVKK